MKSVLIRTALVAGSAITVATTALPQPASADTTSTAIIAGAAAAIIGGLIWDSSRHQYYYVRGGHHYYVSNQTARTWQQHGGRYRGPEGRWHGSRSTWQR